MWPESSLNIGGSYQLWCLLLTVHVLLSWVLSLKNPKKIQGAHFFQFVSSLFLSWVVFGCFFWNLCLFSNPESATMPGINTGLQWKIHLSEVATLNWNMWRRDTCVFKTLHPIGPCPFTLLGSSTGCRRQTCLCPFPLKSNCKHSYCKSLSKQHFQFHESI